MPLRMFLLGLCLPYCLILLGLMRRNTLKATPLHVEPMLRPVWQLGGFWLLLLLGLSIRLPMLGYSGFYYDTNTYMAWALTMSDPANPFNVYREGYFADYPPLYMYVLGLIGMLARFWEITGGPWAMLLLKSPVLLAEALATGLLLGHCRKLYGTDNRVAWWLGGLFICNPLLLFDGVFWGQTDIVYALMVFGAVLLTQQRRLMAAGVLLALGLALKPQTVVFILLFGLWVLRYYPFVLALKIAGVSCLAFILAILPFAWSRDWYWIFTLYMGTAETYSYITVNAYNLWALLGFNWQQSGSLLGVDMTVWTIAVPLLGTALVLCLALREPRAAEHGPVVDGAQRRLLLFRDSFLLVLVFFMLYPRMHERYLFPALLFLLPLLPLGRRWQGLWLALTILGVANLAYVFHHYINIEGGIAPGNSTAIRWISGGMVAFFVFAVLNELPRLHGWFGDRAAQLGETWRRLRSWLGGLPLPLRPPATEPFALRPADFAIVAVLWLATLSLLLFRLGDTLYPENGLVLPRGTTTVDIHYAQPVEVGQLLFYDAEFDAKVRVSAAVDNGWEALPEAVGELELNDFHKTVLKRLDPPVRTQALRLELSGTKGRINEFAAFDVSGNMLLPTTVHSGNEPPQTPDQHPLTDEADKVRLGRGYLASTYFDEIYHGRTGYEFVARILPYETTHPPMGKNLIALGIQAWGVNPYGMRFMGAVAGSLLVPLLFIGGRWLSRRRSGAYTAAILAACGFMSFSISRYATIDTFLVLFLTSSMLLLLRWYQDRDGGVRLGNLGWLCASGLALAFAIATKWSAFYFGAGVFLLFVALVIRDGLLAMQQHQLGHFWLRRFPTVAGGATLAFAVIPLTVYFLSYVHFAPLQSYVDALFSKPGFDLVVKAQGDMYDYHAKLTATHPYSSPWYSWPWIGKPLWVYMDEHAAPLRSVINLLGNPAIWWTGLAALLLLAWQGLRQLTVPIVAIVGAWLSLYLPWLLVDRVSFIYHYYPCVPLLILAIAVLVARLDLRRPLVAAGLGLYLALSAALFVLFYPTLSGLPVAPEYAQWLRWLPGWGTL